jgi:Glutaminase
MVARATPRPLRSPTLLLMSTLALRAALVLALVSIGRPAAAYDLNDSHFHLTNYIQEGTDIRKFLDIMGNRVGRVALFGIPLQQEWSYRVRVYTKQCSVGINTVDLALMGATLANGGVNPRTGKRMLDETSVPELLAIMMTAGFYDESGRWAFDAGLPAKTGVGGGIVAVVPGRFAIAAFSPRLNEAGNSVRAQKAIRYIAGQLGVGVFGPNAE